MEAFPLLLYNLCEARCEECLMYCRMSPILTVDPFFICGGLGIATAPRATAEVRISFDVVNVSLHELSLDDHGTPGSLPRFLLGGTLLFTIILEVAILCCCAMLDVDHDELESPDTTIWLLRPASASFPSGLGGFISPSAV